MYFYSFSIVANNNVVHYSHFLVRSVTDSPVTAESQQVKPPSCHLLLSMALHCVSAQPTIHVLHVSGIQNKR